MTPPTVDGHEYCGERTPPGDPFRLLITGSRKWDHSQSVDRVLRYYLRQAVHHGGHLVVVQGRAYQGADNLAHLWAEHAGRRGWPVVNEPHPAVWTACASERCTPGHQLRRPSGQLYCPYAGFVRNQQMIDSRPHACVAFWRAGSSGTRDCRVRAIDAGIPELAVLWAQRDHLDDSWLDGRAPLAHLTPED